MTPRNGSADRPTTPTRSPPSSVSRFSRPMRRRNSVAGGRLDAGRSPERYWLAKRGSVGGRTPSALRVVAEDGRPLGPDGRPARSQAGSARRRRRLDAHHRPRPHRRRRLRWPDSGSRRSGDHPRWVQVSCPTMSAVGAGGASGCAGGCGGRPTGRASRRGTRRPGRTARPGEIVTADALAEYLQNTAVALL